MFSEFDATAARLRERLRRSTWLAPLLTVRLYRRMRWGFDDHDRQLRLASDNLLRELARRGYAVIPGFFDEHECQRMRGIIDDILDEHADSVQRDAEESDFRLFGANHAHEDIEAFRANPSLREPGSRYVGTPLRATFTLANRVRAIPGNRGSGGGWHRDSLGRQFKAILYLSDVGPENGPFQLIEDSHSLPDVVLDSMWGGLCYGQTRIAGSAVEKIVDSAPDRLKTFVGSAGTLLLVNTCGIHRGAPIERGTRYALTNYYHDADRDTADIIAHFSPMLTG